MKTIDVTSCGDCPFCERREAFSGPDACAIDPGPPPRHRGRWQYIEIQMYKVPADCPLRREMVRVKLDRSKLKPFPSKTAKKSR